jgi:hypothetical protein
MTEPRRRGRTTIGVGPGSNGAGSVVGAAVPADADAGSGDRVAELEARLARLESSPGLRQRGRSMLSGVMPSEAATHFRNAGREQLLGIRTIVDFWIKRIDDSEAGATCAGVGGTRGRRRRETIEIDEA